MFVMMLVGVMLEVGVVLAMEEYSGVELVVGMDNAGG